MSSSHGSVSSGAVDGLAQPLHLQRVYKSLNLNCYLDYVEDFINRPISNSDLDSDDDEDADYSNRLKNWNAETSIFNLAGVQKKRRWVCEAVCHSSDSDCESSPSVGFSFPPSKRQRPLMLGDVAPKRLLNTDADTSEEDFDEEEDEEEPTEAIEEMGVEDGDSLKYEISDVEEESVSRGDAMEDEEVDVEEKDEEINHPERQRKNIGIEEEHKKNKKGQPSSLNPDEKTKVDRKKEQIIREKNGALCGVGAVKIEQKLDESKQDIIGNVNYDQSKCVSDESVVVDCEERGAASCDELKDGIESNAKPSHPTERDDETDSDDDDDSDDSNDEEPTDTDGDETEESDSQEQEDPTAGGVRGEQLPDGTVSSVRKTNLSRIDALLREHMLRKMHVAGYYAEEWNKDAGADGGSGNGAESCVRGRSYLYYGAGLLSNVDRYSDHQRYMACSRRSRGSAHRLRGGPVMGGSGCDRRQQRLGGESGGQLMQGGLVAVKEEYLDDQSMDQNTDSLLGYGEEGDDGLVEGDISKVRARPSSKRDKKVKKLDAQALAVRRHKMWLGMARKEVVRSQRTRAAAHKEQLHNCKRIATAATKAYRQKALQSQKVVKDKVWLLKRLSRSMQVEWKKFDRLVKEQNKRAEREAEEQRKMDKEIMEAKRQQRKVNFLITLPELYAHFMQSKITGTGSSEDTSTILKQLEDAAPATNCQDDYDCEAVKQQALQTAKEAVRSQQSVISKFSSSSSSSSSLISAAGASGEREYRQPEVFMGQLKSYQLKGMNWIANLYYFGINGILADEMGLGKTVQAIAFLAHICEEYDTWGPFLIVTPASTLHNWTAEINRFVPEFKVVPYWGTPEERKSLRKFFDVKSNGDRTSSSFHVVVTSYHIVIQDFKFLNRLKWNYMVLDEAQAIKSINSQRWKLLLGFSCRNRLLLSGTPIQNTMAELWALLHFIMPALFDSHQWFNEWFSKDIEGHAENRTHVDEKHLNRLHTILKPFMLRRIKTEVENELTDKIEIMVYCPLTLRQKFLYSGLKNKISIEELLHSSSGSAAAQSSVTTTLMNLVMQFRKVCNHPELLERREVQSPLLVRPQVALVPRLVFSTARDARPAHNIAMRLAPSATHRIHAQLHAASGSCNSGGNSWLSSWWFASLCGVSASELSAVLQGHLPIIWQLTHHLLHHRHPLARHRAIWGAGGSRGSDDIILPHSSRHSLDHDTIVTSSCSSSSLGANFNSSECRRRPGTVRGAFDTLLLPGQDYNSIGSSAAQLPPLVFCSHSSSFYSFTDHVIHSLPETTAHRTMRLNKLKKPRIEELCGSLAAPDSALTTSTPATSPARPLATSPTRPPTTSPTRPLATSPTTPPDSSSPYGCSSSARKQVSPGGAMSPKKSVKLKTPTKGGQPRSGSTDGPSPRKLGDRCPPPLPHLFRPPITRPCQPTHVPAFITYTCPKVLCSPWSLYCYSQQCCVSAPSDWQLCSDTQHLLQRGVHAVYRQEAQKLGCGGSSSYCSLQTEVKGGLEAYSAAVGWNNILIPDKHSLMMDAGKLYVLDSLLSRMKAAGNRVLIYSQMTKMINLLEEYMRHRQHKYMRLDGSSKISDRRDMVADFQSKSDIFVFLLSTRAGGVGINLTAADTVIFYDSDWNPTVDQQAMDRAHRVGQTKQVTVYRLICKGTIEERILQRAKEKSEIQRMVISGGNFKPDSLKPKEVVSLLLDDDIEQQFRARQHERRALDEQRVEYNREKMRKRYAEKKLEREQQEVKRRRVDDDLPIDVCGSPANSLTNSSESEEVSVPLPGGGVDDTSSDIPPLLVDEAGPSSTPSPAPTPVGVTTPPAMLPGSSSCAVPGTTVRGHRKRGRPRMSTVRGRSGIGRGGPVTAATDLGAAASYGATGVVKRGRGRPRLLPLGPGHQGQRPQQVLPAALGALQQRGSEDAQQ